MHVLTNKQITKMVQAGQESLYVSAHLACNTINDIADTFERMTQEQKEQAADRLRRLADDVDGRQTSNGKGNTYSYIHTS